MSSHFFLLFQCSKNENRLNLISVDYLHQLHHSLVLMLEDMAVENEFPGEAQVSRPQGRQRVSDRQDRIFPYGLPNNDASGTGLHPVELKGIHVDMEGM
jgi:hypothetical protein